MSGEEVDLEIDNCTFSKRKLINYKIKNKQNNNMFGKPENQHCDKISMVQWMPCKLHRDKH